MARIVTNGGAGPSASAVWEPSSDLARAVQDHEMRLRIRQARWEGAAIALLGVVLALSAVVFWGCSESWVGPVTPVTPVDPVEPQPAPPAPSQVATYAAVHSILPGWTRSQVEAAMGFPATLESRQDDGTSILRWPAVGATGAPRWADVQLDAGGLVIGHVLLPRLEVK